MTEDLGVPSVSVKFKHPGNKITATLSFGGRKNMLKFLSWIYEDSTVFIERKYLRYLYVSRPEKNNPITWKKYGPMREGE